MADTDFPGSEGPYSAGQMVIVPPHGPGRIERIEDQAGTKGVEPHLVVSFAAGHQLKIALSEAEEDLRPTVDRATAEKALEILRSPDTVKDLRPFEERFSERMATVASGDLLKMSTLLRSLYGSSTEASPGERKFRSSLEDQVLCEIGQVLDLTSSGLAMEMNHRHMQNQSLSADPPETPQAENSPEPPPTAQKAETAEAIPAAPPAVACHVHPQKAATDTCAKCLKPVCEICALADKTRFLCPECTHKHRRNRRIIQATVALMVLGFIGSVSAYFLFVYEEPFDYGRYTAKVHRLSKRLNQDPCDRVKMLKMAELLLDAGDLKGTVARSQQFFDECAPFPRLLWVTFEANKRMGEYNKALEDVDQLIEKFPYDKDFRWWRGEVHERMRNWDLALGDYRQSLGLQPRLRSIPFDLARIAPNSSMPCEAIFALEQFVYHHPDYQNDPTVLLQLERLYRAEACRGLAGTGQATIARGGEQEDEHLQLNLNESHSGSFVLDMDLGYTLLSESFAQKIGLVTRDHFIAFDGQEVREGKIAFLETMELDKAITRRVAVVVIRDKFIPEGRDGILGLTFLTRFALSYNPEDGALLLADKLEQDEDKALPPEPDDNSRASH